MTRISEPSISERLMPPDYVLTLPQESDAARLNEIRADSWWQTVIVDGAVKDFDPDWLRAGMATYTSPKHNQITADRIAVARGELVVPGTKVRILVARCAIDAARRPVEDIMKVPPTGYIAVDKWFGESDPHGLGQPTRQELSTLQTGVTGSGVGLAMMAGVETFWHPEVPVDVGSIKGTYSVKFYEKHGFKPHPDEDFVWTNSTPEYVLVRDLPVPPEDTPYLHMLRHKRPPTPQEVALAQWGLVLANRNQRVSA